MSTDSPIEPENLVAAAIDADPHQTAGEASGDDLEPDPSLFPYSRVIVGEAAGCPDALADFARVTTRSL